MKIIPICYCGNRKIFEGVTLSVLSVIKHTSAALDIILLTMDLCEQNPDYLPFSEEQGALLDRLVKGKNPNSRVRIIDVTELQHKYFSGGKNQKNSYTPYASIRLLLDLIADMPDKIVYLDTDIMCLGNVEELYDTDIENYEFAASLDIVGHNFFPYDYCNSGVLLLNMPYIKRSGLFAKARDRVRKRTMMMPDQSALNFLCEAKLVLPYRFNEQRAIKPDTVFKHFCMGYKWHGILLRRYNYKQWHRDKIHEYLGIYDFDDIFEQYDKIVAEEAAKESSSAASV